jgi:hypothetical protein
MAEQSQPSEITARILAFRPRISGRARGNLYSSGSKSREQHPPVASMTQYERANEGDDFRHRMTVNGLAFVLIVMLTAAGVWLADSLAALRKTQDCALAGRPNCAMIDFNRPPAPAARDQFVKAR